MAQQYTLSKDGIHIGIDEQGRLIALHRQGEPNLVRVARAGIWRLFLCRIEDQEIPILPEDQSAPRIEQTTDTITLTYASLSCRGTVLDLAMVLAIQIVDGEVQWHMSLDNRSDVMVSEAWYPIIGGLADLAGSPDRQWLAWPLAGGSRIPDPRRWLRSSHSGYRGADQFEIVTRLHYPYPASMPWCDLHSETSGLFLGCFDPRFRNGFLVGLLEGSEMSLGYVKHPFAGKGEHWDSPVYVVAPHAGDWRWGAARYRRWAETWLQFPVIPEWLRTWFGWQRTILEHQYGEVLWTYDQLEELCAHAHGADLDALHILGWWRGGMDRAYPHYDYDERLGGEAAFRRAIQKVRATGMRVLPYINGRLLDVTMPYFKEHGSRLAAKTLLGTDYRETYPFWGRGALVSGLGRLQVQHGIPCPACGDWWDEVERIVRQVIGLGADGILIDQVGGMLDRLCFDPNHGHKRPDEAFPLASDHYLGRLRRQLKADHPDFVLGCEHVVDMTARHFDFIHGCGTGFHPGGNAFPALIRYTFPEFIFTNRDGGYDETAFRHHIGFAMLNGFRFDMSVYRCRGSMADLPNYAQILPRVRNLHRTADNLVMTGRYTHDDEYGLAADPLQHAGYLGSDGRLAVVTWNPGDTAVNCPRPDCGRPLQRVVDLEGSHPASASHRLDPEDVAIWIFGQ